MEFLKNDNFWLWVEKNINEPPARLRLTYDKSLKEQPWIASAITQIECRQKFGKKLAQTLKAFPRFYFPGRLNGEQSSGDLAATFHSSLIKDGDTVVDLTAGLGIDTLHFCEKASRVTAVEKDSELCEALRYNAEGLGITNLTVINGDCNELISTFTADVFFIDPARRDGNGDRVYSLSDCTPNLDSSMQDELARQCKRLIIKMSPMLDITAVKTQIHNVSNIYCIGTPTECKEIVSVSEFSATENFGCVIDAVTLTDSVVPNQFSFTQAEEHDSVALFSSLMPKVGDILFVPYPSVMKAAPVKLLSSRFRIYKFHSNTHLYFGDKNIVDFPGDKLEIVDIIKWQSKNLKRLKNKYPFASVSVRNFSMTAVELQNKLGIKEGGKERIRLFGIGLGKDHTEKLLIVTRPNIHNT